MLKLPWKSRSRWETEFAARLNGILDESLATLESRMESVADGSRLCQLQQEQLVNRHNQLADRGHSQNQDINHALHAHSVFIKELLDDRTAHLDMITRITELNAGIMAKHEELVQTCVDLQTRMGLLEATVSDLDDHLAASHALRAQQASQIDERITQVQRETSSAMVKVQGPGRYTTHDLVVAYQESTKSTATPFKIRTIIGEITTRHQLGHRGWAQYEDRQVGNRLEKVLVYTTEGAEFILSKLGSLDGAAGETPPPPPVPVNAITVCILALVEENQGSWTGTATQILQSFPTIGLNASHLSRTIRSLDDELDTLGIRTTFGMTARTKTITFTRRQGAPMTAHPISSV